jgi:pimeloyl-ACP methyl ester carboxylesterase
VTSISGTADWHHWENFHKAQEEVILPAGAVAHLPVHIRYIDAGAENKGTVVLLHGIPTWGYLFHRTIPELVGAGYRVIAPDLLGHGFSDRRDCFDRSFQDQARMVLALLSHLGISRFDLVGHDTGGATGLILAIEHAHCINRLVISNSVCYDRFDDDMLDFGHPMRWKPRPVSDLTEALESSLAEGLSNPDQLTPEFRAGILAPWSTEEGKLSLIRNASSLNANQTMALVDRHGIIKAPTLVLWGMDDPWQSAADGQQLASEIPGARFQGIAGASHWLPQDAHESFTSAVIEFLGLNNSTT